MLQSPHKPGKAVGLTCPQHCWTWLVQLWPLHRGLQACRSSH